jgi:predicted transcriptional regulator
LHTPLFEVRIMQTSTELVSDIMSQPVLVVGPESTVRELFELSRRRLVHHFPILERGALFGIVCTCDLRDAAPDATVRAFARREVTTIDAAQSIADAARVMAKRAVGSAVVIGPEGVYGIVTRGDLLRLGTSANLLEESHCACCGSYEHLRAGPDGAFLCADCKQRASGEDWFDTGVGD